MNSYTYHIHYTCLETAAAVPWSGSALRCTVSLCRLCCCVPWVLVGGLSPIGGPAGIACCCGHGFSSSMLEKRSCRWILNQWLKTCATTPCLCHANLPWLFHGLPLLALQEKSQILGRVWTKLPKKGRQLLFLSDITMQIARVQCARYPCKKKNTLQIDFFPKKGRKESSTNQQTKLKIYKHFK